MNDPSRRPKGLIRRAERWAVGATMAALAFVLERLVMRALKRRGEPPTEPATDGSAYTVKRG